METEGGRVRKTTWRFSVLLTITLRTLFSGDEEEANRPCQGNQAEFLVPPVLHS